MNKLNMLSISSRPDFAIQAKLLTTKYGSATKRDLLTAIKLLKLAKQEPTKFVIPNLGNVEDWLLVGISDASYKTSAQSLAIAGHIIMLVNKHSGAASVLHWSSQKINRRISSSLAAETIALQKLSEIILFCCVESVFWLMFWIFLVNIIKFRFQLFGLILLTIQKT